MQITGRRLADGEIERLRRFGVRQFIGIVIGENHTNGLGGGRKPEDIEGRGRPPVNKMCADTVVEDPAFIADPTASKEVIDGGVTILRTGAENERQPCKDEGADDVLYGAKVIG